MNKPSFCEKPLWRDIFRPVLVLFVISAVVAAALAGANAVTKNKIAALSEKQAQESMQTLFPGAQFREERYPADVTSSVFPFLYYRAEKDGQHEGYIFTTSAKGYGGDVSVMTAVTADGKIKAVKILDVSNETPGLGQNAAKEDFYGQLAGLSAESEISLNKTAPNAGKNEIAPVTGATITSKAAKDAVNEALRRYSQIIGENAGGWETDGQPEAQNQPETAETEGGENEK